MWEATFTISLGFVLTVLIGGAYASYLQRRSWEHQNQSRLDEEKRKQATEICRALSESIDRRRYRLWCLVEAIEERVQGKMPADELRERRSECEKAMADWNDQLTTRLVNVGVYFGQAARDHLKTTDQNFQRISDEVEQLYRQVASVSEATVEGVDTSGAGSVKTLLGAIGEDAYGLCSIMMQRIGEGESGRTAPYQLQSSQAAQPSEATRSGAGVLTTEGTGPERANATVPVPGSAGQKATPAGTGTADGNGTPVSAPVAPTLSHREFVAGEQGRWRRGPSIAIAASGQLWIICMSLPLWKEYDYYSKSGWQLLTGAGSLPGLMWAWLPVLAMLAIAVLAGATLTQRWSRYRAVTQCSAIAVGAVSVVTLVALGVEATDSYRSYCGTVIPADYAGCLRAEGLGVGYYFCIAAAALTAVSGLWAAIQSQRRRTGSAV